MHTFSAGRRHTVLLRSDGAAVACGDNEEGGCDLPELEEGTIYTQVVAGCGHTILLRSDGAAVACGRNDWGQCNLPAMEEGTTYVQVAAGMVHTVVLRSDGETVVRGCNEQGQCNVPALEAGVYIISSSQPDLVVQLFIKAVAGTIEVDCRNLSGEQLASWIVPDKASHVKQCIQQELAPIYQRLFVVLPDGRLVGAKLTWQHLWCELSMPAYYNEL